MGRKTIYRNQCIALLLIFTPLSATALWPFDSPAESALKQMCKNSANQAEHAAKSRDMGVYLSEMLDSFNDPGWNKKENRIQKGEWVKATRLAYKHKTVSPETLHDMQYDMCISQRAKYIRLFEQQGN